MSQSATSRAQIVLLTTWNALLKKRKPRNHLSNQIQTNSASASTQTEPFITQPLTPELNIDGTSDSSDQLWAYGSNSEDSASPSISPGTGHYGAGIQATDTMAVDYIPESSEDPTSNLETELPSSWMPLLLSLDPELTRLGLLMPFMPSSANLEEMVNWKMPTESQSNQSLLHVCI
ncbi:hypothetical protein B7463_g7039, partial [Scytalidium lignicola]